VITETFLANIEKGQIAPVYFLYGSEKLYQNEILNALTEKLITPDNRDFNLESFDGKTTTISDWITASQTMSFLGGTKLVIVRNIHEASLDAKACEPLLDLVADIPEDVCLVLTADKADKKKKVFKTLCKLKGALSCEPPKEAALIPWIRKRAQPMGYTLSAEAARMLVNRVGAKPGILAMELDKLLTYCGKKKKVSEDDVLQVIGDIRLENPFALTEALKNKNADRALRLLHNQLDHGEDPIKVMGAIAWQFRVIWEVKHYQAQNMPTAKIAQAMGANPFMVEKAMGHTGNFDQDSLVRSFRNLSAADRDLKSSGKDPQGVLESLILNLCAGKN